MTREEIINEIKCLLSELNNGEDAVSYLTQNDVKWLNENIKALEPPSIKTIEEVQDEMDYGKVYTSQYFKKMIEEGSINSYDGGGYYHDGQNETDISVWSKWTIDTTYPYVCWYSK